jgi:hypothetical protein
MVPIELGGLVQTIDDVVVAHFDCEFPTIVETDWVDERALS